MPADERDPSPSSPKRKSGLKKQSTKNVLRDASPEPEKPPEVKLSDGPASATTSKIHELALWPW